MCSELLRFREISSGFFSETDEVIWGLGFSIHGFSQKSVNLEEKRSGRLAFLRFSFFLSRNGSGEDNHGKERCVFIRHCC